MVVTEIKSIRNMFLRVIVSKALLEAKLLSRVWFFATPWSVVYQAPQSMQFSRRECWSGLPFPSPGDLPNPGIEPGSPALQVDALPSEPPGKPKNKHCKTWPKRLWLMKLNSLWPPNFLGQGAACECSSASKEIPFFSASLRCYECLGTGEHTEVESKAWRTVNLRDTRRTSRANLGRAPISRIMGLTVSAQWVFREAVRPWLPCDSLCSCLNRSDCCSFLVPCLPCVLEM